MIITYNGEKLRYVEDYYGEPVLWITKPSQISMEHMKFVGGYPDEYCIYFKDLSETDVIKIREQVVNGAE